MIMYTKGTYEVGKRGKVVYAAGTNKVVAVASTKCNAALIENIPTMLYCIDMVRSLLDSNLDPDDLKRQVRDCLNFAVRDIT